MKTFFISRWQKGWGGWPLMADMKRIVAQGDYVKSLAPAYQRWQY